MYALCFDGRNVCVRCHPKWFPTYYFTSSLVQNFSSPLFLLFGLAFGTMPTKIQDVAVVIVMSSWYDLCWQGHFKTELGVSVSALRMIHGFQDHRYAVTTVNSKTDIRGFLFLKIYIYSINLCMHILVTFMGRHINSGLGSIFILSLILILILFHLCI